MWGFQKTLHGASVYIGVHLLYKGPHRNKHLYMECAELRRENFGICRPLTQTSRTALRFKTVGHIQVLFPNSSMVGGTCNIVHPCIFDSSSNEFCDGVCWLVVLIWEIPCEHPVSSCLVKIPCKCKYLPCHYVLHCWVL